MSQIIFVHILILMGLATVQGHTTSAYNHDSTLPTYRGDWMRNLSSTLYLHQLSLPGTHDTMAFYGGVAAQTQSLSLIRQLDGGIRVLDIRCRLYQDALAIHHGMIFQHAYLDDVLQIVGNFLSNHSSETVVLKVKEEWEPVQNTKSFWQVFEGYVKPYEGVIWKPNSSNDQPTLGDLRGKMIFIDAYTGFKSASNSNGTLSTSLFTAYGLYYRNPNMFSNQDDYKLTTDFELGKKWKLVKAQLVFANSSWVSQGGKDAKFFINYLSANDVATGVFPYFVASGHITPASDSDRMPTGITDPLGAQLFPDFPKIHCILSKICMYYFEGINVLTFNWIQENSPNFVGIIMADFPGDDLIGATVGLNYIS